MKDHAEVVRVIGSDARVNSLHDHALHCGYTRDAPEHGIEALLELMRIAGVNSLAELLSLVAVREASIRALIAALRLAHAEATNHTGKPPMAAPSFACVLAIALEYPQHLDDGAWIHVGWGVQDVSALIACIGTIQASKLARDKTTSVRSMHVTGNGSDR